MNQEKTLVSGIRPMTPHENAPDFVILKLGLNVDSFREWLKANQPNEAGWVNMEVLKKKDGSGLYVVKDDWKPEPKFQPKVNDSELEDIPF
tara:strand:+ start:246 stop:518 length:273 start_codon:yes stop_codon:yes gene_type:complete